MGAFGGAFFEGGARQYGRAGFASLHPRLRASAFLERVVARALLCHCGGQRGTFSLFFWILACAGMTNLQAFVWDHEVRA